ncbi:malate dehydrogenase (oxaloacetate-decarboxylating) [Caldalkalibacillus uzonensis]|uniref:Malate dehydrogenase (Oxaloacetate-decarboxylating) n=1 Tax=Caldalkalibacillus uzonensis TaxID=353224 RepID=A0ABU0CU78_9BACI|nr:malic enzyme-like NAD(P)-binding protein [Caldalkalibacillus uzonensis]MDQ0339967.1 malate dehydrogenase (oxaloacetate-decarboxylating) [Caldalkalibacillus uzonensis]
MNTNDSDMLLLDKTQEEALLLHSQCKGKLEISSKVRLTNQKDLSLAYSPGVAEPCKEIFKAPHKVYDYTMKGNMVAIVTNGTSVLGLGNIGPQAALPVMEGKSVLFKSFAGVDAFPICIDSTDIDKIVSTVKMLEPTFGGVNLEDISAPSCFEIEERLKKGMGIPVFHDDQHGTAIVTLAGLINALKLTNRSLTNIRVVVNGAGAAGIAIIKLLKHFGVKDIMMCDSKGAVFEGRPYGMNAMKREVSQFTNLEKKQGSLQDIIVGADVFIGVSVAGALTPEMIKSMNKDPIIFALANPIPEVMPDVAKKAGAKIIATGRSDFPNQINNVLAFPGIFRGALDVNASEINERMKEAAVYAIASLVSDEELREDYVIPSPFDGRVAPAVASAVAKAAMETGVARKKVNPMEVLQNTKQMATISRDG